MHIWQSCGLRALSEWVVRSRDTQWNRSCAHLTQSTLMQCETRKRKERTLSPFLLFKWTCALSQCFLHLAHLKNPYRLSPTCTPLSMLSFSRVLAKSSDSELDAYSSTHREAILSGSDQTMQQRKIRNVRNSWHLIFRKEWSTLNCLPFPKLGTVPKMESWKYGATKKHWGATKSQLCLSCVWTPKWRGLHQVLKNWRNKKFNYPHAFPMEACYDLTPSGYFHNGTRAIYITRIFLPIPILCWTWTNTETSTFVPILIVSEFYKKQFNRKRPAHCKGENSIEVRET